MIYLCVLLEMIIGTFVMEGRYNTHYVCNHGIAYQCDVHPVSLISDYPIVQGYNKQICTGDTVYVVTSALPDFINRVYPTLKMEKTQIILVTGDSDCNATKKCPLSIEQLKTDNIIRHWFCQNIDTEETDFITPLPIGIDYHSIHRNPCFNEPRTHYITQDQVLQKLASNIEDKDIRVLLDAHLSKHTNPTDREMAYQQLSKCSFVDFLPKSLPRTDYWKHVQKYKFIVSPLGHGIDCHRTWEAIALGVVPIVKKTTLASLLSDYPVILVDEYTDITKELLLSYKYPRDFDKKSITLKYWNDKINNRKYECFPERLQVSRRYPECYRYGCTVCLPVHKSSVGLPYVLKNVDKIAQVFNGKIHVVAVCSQVSQTCINMLVKYDSNYTLEVIQENTNARSRTGRLADVRNQMLDRAYDIGYKYCIMMDTNDYSCIGEINVDLLSKALNRDDWDAISFNRSEGYYDHWALSYEPYVHSFFHWTDWRSAVAKFRESISKKFSTKGEMIPVLSAFNGFSIYRLKCFEGCKYSEEIDVGLYPIGSLEEQRKVLGQDYSIHNTGDCEHRRFHLEGIKRGCRIMMLNEDMFGKNPH